MPQRAVRPSGLSWHRRVSCGLPLSVCFLRKSSCRIWAGGLLKIVGESRQSHLEYAGAPPPGHGVRAQLASCCPFSAGPPTHPLSYRIRTDYKNVTNLFTTRRSPEGKDRSFNRKRRTLCRKRRTVSLNGQTFSQSGPSFVVKTRSFTMKRRTFIEKHRTLQVKRRTFCAKPPTFLLKQPSAPRKPRILRMIVKSLRSGITPEYPSQLYYYL